MANEVSSPCQHSGVQCTLYPAAAQEHARLSLQPLACTAGCGLPHGWPLTSFVAQAPLLSMPGHLSCSPQGNMSVSDLQVYAAETNAALNKPVAVTTSGDGSNLEALSGAG